MLESLKRRFAEKSFKRVQIAAIVFIVLIFTLTLTMAASASSSYNVAIKDGQKTIMVSTRKSEPSEILESAKVVFGENDLLDTSAFSEGTASNLTIYRACNVTVFENGKAKNLVACKNVEYTLANNAINLDSDDYISAKYDEPVYEGMAITLDRAFDVTVTADGKATVIRVTPGTVGEALVKAQVVLDNNDEVSSTLDTALFSGMSITVFRIDYSQRTENETIEFENTTRNAKDIYIGETRLSQTGANGSKTVVYEDRYVDGVFEKASVLSETIIREAVPQVTLIGTKVKVAAIKFQPGLSPISDLALPEDVKLDADGVPAQYSKIIEGTAKAYTGGGITATGRPAMEGYIAVDPNVIPYGTRLYVASLDGKYIYGYCIAADTGGFVSTNGCTIDMYMNTENECIQFGHRGIRIYVLD